ESTGNPLLQSRDACGRRDASELEPLLVDDIGVVFRSHLEPFVDRRRVDARAAWTLALGKYARRENGACLVARKRRQKSRELEVRRRVAGSPLLLPVREAEPVQPTEPDLDATDTEGKEEVPEDAGPPDDAADARFLEQQGEPE